MPMLVCAKYYCSLSCGVQGGWRTGWPAGWSPRISSSCTRRPRRRWPGTPAYRGWLFPFGGNVDALCCIMLYVSGWAAEGQGGGAGEEGGGDHTRSPTTLHPKPHFIEYYLFLQSTLEMQKIVSNPPKKQINCG